MSAADDPRVEAAARAMRIEEVGNTVREGLAARMWDTGAIDGEVRDKYVRLARAALAAADAAAPARTLPDRSALNRAIRNHLVLYTLPANVAAYSWPEDTHRKVANRCAPLIADAVLAVLADQPTAPDREDDALLDRMTDLLTRIAPALADWADQHRDDPEHGEAARDFLARAARERGEQR